MGEGAPTSESKDNDVVSHIRTLHKMTADGPLSSRTAEASNFLTKVSTSCLITSPVLMKKSGKALSRLVRRVGSDHLSCGTIPDIASFLSAGEHISEANSNNFKLWAARDFEATADLLSFCFDFNAPLMALSKRTSPFLLMLISSAYANLKAFISSFTSFNCALAH